MLGDVSMLRSFGGIWYQRFKSNTSSSPPSHIDPVKAKLQGNAANTSIDNDNNNTNNTNDNDNNRTTTDLNNNNNNNTNAKSDNSTNNNNNNSSNVAGEKKSWLTFLRDIYAVVHVDISYKEVGPMIPDDIPLSAIDFHCSSIVSNTTVYYSILSY